MEHGTEGGFDAWRKLYNRYIPGAEDLQNLLMEELMNLKPVGEHEIDSLFTEIERITEWYIKADSKGEAMNNKWVRAALVKNLPRTITQHLAVELRKANTIDAIYTLIMVYMHDHSTGLPRGQGIAKLYLTEEDERTQEQPREDQKEKQTEKTNE